MSEVMANLEELDGRLNERRADNEISDWIAKKGEARRKWECQ